MHDQVLAGRLRRPGARTRTPRAAATSAREGSTSTSVTCTPGDPCEQACHAAADHSGPDDRDPVADERPRVPESVDGGLDGPGQHRTSGRDVVRDDVDRFGRHHTGRLVRVQAEHRATPQVGRPVLHHADGEVAVLDRSREVTLLERRPHRGALALGHPTVEDQRLGAAAHARRRPRAPAPRRDRARRARPGGSRRRRARAPRTRVPRSPSIHPTRPPVEPAHRFRRTNSCIHLNGDGVSTVQSDLTKRLVLRIGPANIVTFVRGVLSVRRGRSGPRGVLPARPRSPRSSLSAPSP